MSHENRVGVSGEGRRRVQPACIKSIGLPFISVRKELHPYSCQSLVFVPPLLGSCVT